MQSSLLLRSRGLQFLFINCFRPLLPTSSARRLSAVATEAKPKRNTTNQTPKARHPPLASSFQRDPSTASTPKIAGAASTRPAGSHKAASTFTPKASYPPPKAASTPKAAATSAADSSRQHSPAPSQLLDVAKEAAEAGAKVVREAIAKRSAMSLTKSKFKARVPNTLALEAMASSRMEILKVLAAHFPNHAVLTEQQEKGPGAAAGAPGPGADPEGDATLGYVWCVDSLNGIVNFEHMYPFFAVSVGAMAGAEPVAGCVIEFSGGQGAWFDMTYSAYKSGGATLDGRPIKPSSIDNLNNALLGTHNDTDVILPNQSSVKLFKHMTHITQGVRKLGSPAVALCHVAKGTLDGYWAYMDKPWSMCAASLIVREAGGTVSTMLGTPFSPFHRSILASNGKLQELLLGSSVKAETLKLVKRGAQLYPSCIPLGYDAGFASEEVVKAGLEAAERAKPTHIQAKPVSVDTDDLDSKLPVRTDSAEAWLTEPDRGEAFLPEYTVLEEGGTKSRGSRAPPQSTQQGDRRSGRAGTLPPQRERKKLFDSSD